MKSFVDPSAISLFSFQCLELIVFVITDVRKKQIMNAKSDKIRQQIYVVHQFGYIHGRERDNILLCEENQITQRKECFSWCKT